MIGLSVRQVVKITEDGRRERLLWLNPDGRGGWFIDIDDPRAVPICRGRTEVEDLLAEGLMIVIDDPWLGSGEALSDAQASRGAAAWEAIRPIATSQPQSFDPRKRAALTQSRVAETGITRQRLYRLLRRWWQRGMTPTALTPDYANSGAPGKRKAANGVKRGAPVQYGAEGLNVDDEVRTAFLDTVTRYLAVKKKLSITDCYHQCLKLHFCDLVLNDETGRQDLVLREAHPSIWQFRYWLEQDNDLYALARKRRTPRVYDKDSRGILGTSLDEVIGPGSRYQIDATIADIYLVSRFDRRKIVGRPVVYVIIDVFSRMITGLYVGLEGPSWVGAMMALANAASPKAKWCRSFGVEISEADWPCQSLPSALLADRGEMLGPKSDTLIQRFGVRIENTPPYRADWKGIVERRFGLIHAAFGPYTPGFVEPNFRERGAHDYRLDATLDLDEFTALIINIVLYYNNQHVLSGYVRDPQMIADEVSAVPIELWDWGIQRRTGMQRSFPGDLVKLALLPTEQATVTAQGIRFYGNYYSCTRAIEEHWFEKARQTRTWKEPISYEPRLMDRIWLRDPKGREAFIPCDLTTRSDVMRSKTLWEIDQLRREDRRQKAERAPAQRQGRINMSERIEEIVNIARAKRPDDDRPKATRLGDIRTNRAEERAANRQQEAFNLHSTPRGPAAALPFDKTASPPSDDYSLPDIDSIRQRLMEQDEGKTDE